jgi:putative acetyltransferase
LKQDYEDVIHSAIQYVLATDRGTFAGAFSAMFFPGSRAQAGLVDGSRRNELANLVIRTAEPRDFEIICSLHHHAFGDEKIPRLVDALLNTPAAIAPSSLVAASTDGELVGHVLLSAARRDASKRPVDVMTLSPLAVSEAFRKRGIGAKLIESALAGADALGIPLVFLEGDPAIIQGAGSKKRVPSAFALLPCASPTGRFRLRGFRRTSPG